RSLRRRREPVSRVVRSKPDDHHHGTRATRREGNAAVTFVSWSWPLAPSELPDARFLQTHGRTVANAEIHDAAGSEPDESAIRGQLHPVNELALPVDDIVNRPAIDVLTRSDPEIPVGVGAGRTRRERGLVVR